MGQKITFARINCKDSPIIGINHDPPQTKKNCRILLDAEQEYLQGVANLQQQVRDKYGPLIEDQSEEDLDWDQDFDRDQIAEWEASLPNTRRHEFRDLYSS